MSDYYVASFFRNTPGDVGSPDKTFTDGGAYDAETEVMGLLKFFNSDPSVATESRPTRAQLMRMPAETIVFRYEVKTIQTVVRTFRDPDTGSNYHPPARFAEP